MVAVVPAIPWGCATHGWLATNAATLNSYINAHLWGERPQALRGPDLWTFFQQHPALLRDCIHPTYTAPPGQLSGYEQYQRQWATTILQVAGGLEIEYFARIRPGDTLVATRTLADIYEKQGRSGALIFYVVVLDVRREDGTPVLRETTTRILR